MEQYSRMDTPYSRSRYEQGIDSKIVIMGNSGVGKTSLLQRYTQNKFDPKNTTSTSGAFFVTKKVYVNGLKVRLQLWDTAGQERFRSMAPMYYRGANAALLLYDITNASTFDDIRGWLEELKKNCQPELIIYIVGSKADLSSHRQVTSDLARLSLHNWFPPPRPPTPPPPPQLSTLSYIRPRFTSFPGLRSPPVSPPTADTPAYLDLQAARSSALSRTTQSQSPPTSAGSSRSTRPQQSRFGSHFGIQAGGWSQIQDSGSNSLNEDDEHVVEDEEEEREWGLSKGMELFEVSAKDDLGIQNLFDHLISAIIVRKDRIEAENELKKRDSVFLTSVAAPAWSAQAEEEEAREKAERERSARGWSCC
ncbi:P-loop containing nucleoside triphosphate hydrolase protein, partial [Mycena maculata]